MILRSILLVAVFLVCWYSSSVEADGQTAAGKHLFILSGQSNMARLDAGQTFIPRLVDEFGAENITVIKVAEGGQPISRWLSDWKSADGKAPPTEKAGDLYKKLIEEVRSAGDPGQYETVTFLWMQGEADTKAGRGEVYETALRQLLKNIESDLGRTDLKVVIGRISDYGVSKPERPNWNTVREAQEHIAVTRPATTLVNTDDLNDGRNERGGKIQNDLHYSVEGYQTFGKRLAEEAVALIRTGQSPTGS